jgi:hypothetical protein
MFLAMLGTPIRIVRYVPYLISIWFLQNRPPRKKLNFFQVVMNWIYSQVFTKVKEVKHMAFFPTGNFPFFGRQKPGSGFECGSEYTKKHCNVHGSFCTYLIKV